MRQRLGFRHEDLDPGLNELASSVVDAVFTVRHELGAGLVESVYAACLADELSSRGIPIEREVRIPIFFKGRQLEKSFRLDLLVADEVVVEVKSTEAIHPTHVAQLLTYLRLSRKPLGFLVNFNAIPLASGIRRFANSNPTP